MGRGRPANVFSTEEIRRIAEALLDNNMSQKLAAAVMGISVSSFGNWLDQIGRQTGLDLRTVSGAVNARDWGKILSRGDRVRAMTDEQLALYILKLNDIDGGDTYCRNNGKCKGVVLENDAIPDAWCVECIKSWLKEVPE